MRDEEQSERRLVGSEPFPPHGLVSLHFVHREYVTRREDMKSRCEAGPIEFRGLQRDAGLDVGSVTLADDTQAPAP